MTILSSHRIMGINNIISFKWPKAVMMVTIISWVDFFRIFKIGPCPPSLIPPSQKYSTC